MARSPLPWPLVACAGLLVVVAAVASAAVVAVASVAAAFDSVSCRELGPPRREHPDFSRLRRRGDVLVREIRAFRAVHGRLPEHLDELAICKVQDVCSGWEYRRFDDRDGFALWTGDYSRDGYLLGWSSEDGDWYLDT